jgi:all-trans-nonaprenyl-diphosphate synthase
MIFSINHTDILVLQSRELTTEHRRLAEIIEMIHTASLIHDDVIDDSGMRRGMYKCCFFRNTSAVLSKENH